MDKKLQELAPFCRIVEFNKKKYKKIISNVTYCLK